MPSTAERWSITCAIVGFGTLTLWWFWPLPLVWATHTGHSPPSQFEEADYYLIMWVLAWVAHVSVRAPWQLFHANTFYPSTLSLAYSEHFIGLQPLFAPIYWASGNPLLATNVVMVGNQFCCALTTYLLARRFVRPPAAFLAGFYSTFCAWRYLAIFHFHIFCVLYLPLVVLFLHRWVEDGRTRDAVCLTIVLTLQLLSGYYVAYATVVGVGTAALVFVWQARGLDRRRGLGLALVGLVSASILGLVSAPYLYLRFVGLIPEYDATSVPLGVAAAPGMVADVLVRQGVGPIGYALAGIALVPPWTRLRLPRLLGLGLVVTSLLTAVGPVLHVGPLDVPTLYPILVACVPGFSSVRVPMRLTVVALLGLGLLAAVGFERMVRRRSDRQSWPLALLLVLTVTVVLLRLPPLRLQEQPVGEAVPPEYRWLAAHGGGAVLELPVARSADVEARRMFLSTVHWLPVVGGYSAYGPGTKAYVEKIAEHLPDPGALQMIRDAVDVRWIVLHAGPRVARRWTLPDGLSIAAEFPSATILRVTGGGDVRKRENFFRPDLTPAGVPLVSLGPRCPGTLDLTDLPDRAAPGAHLLLLATVTNASDRPWPGFAFVERHVVRLRACFAPLGVASCRGTPFALGADLAPGASARVLMNVVAPAERGDYALHVALEQVGDEPPAACGVEPLVLPLHVES